MQINLTKTRINTNFKPAVHGGNVFEAVRDAHLSPNKILDFSANINPLGPSPKVLEAIKNNLWRVKLYPDPDMIVLRKAVAEHVGGNINPENVILGNGATELIHLFTDVFITKGCNAVIPIPTFEEYEVAVVKYGGKPVFVRLEQDFSIKPQKILERTNKNTRVIFLCNPNNPTGVFTSKEDLLEILEKTLNRDIWVFLDEHCIEFTSEDGSVVGEINRYPNLFVLRSFTKVFGLAGLRIGYGIVNEEAAKLLCRVKIPWNINCLAEVAAIAALKDKEHLEKTKKTIKEERIFLFEELKKIKHCNVFPSEANYILLDIRKSGLKAKKLKEEALKHGILIRDCSSFRGLDEYYIRVSIKTRRENEKLVETFKKLLT